MNRKYELVYVVSPEATDEQVTELHTQVESIVQRMNGTLEKSENWGRRKLAYEIGRHKEGTYVLEVIVGGGDLMKEIDRPDHPPPGRPRGRGAGCDRAHARAPHRDLAPPARGARPARGSAARRRAARRAG
jgi:ribosomal protein S6